MVNKLISIRLPKQLVTEIESIVKMQGYTSMQELIKEAIRVQVAQKRQAWALSQLDLMAGSQKIKQNLTPKQRKQFVESYSKK
jgi:Arc/MetJ-type ribon-helix-helix transcriptional regulator